MFFFFVGGVRHQVTEIIERDAARCLRCTYPANLVNYDNLLEIFFIPVWRWPCGKPALHCTNCGFLVPNGHFRSLTDNIGSASSTSRSVCWSCARSLEHSFRFCPDCGAREDL
ncbi:hypothetical protein KP509_03G032700 [Ceratopteris richardii]|uniref:Zinc-ribbon 15 domain-containing protein n=1 Tax=Ceratopteris richardii TaxID=49495 RepID=A0A8T2UYP7_CERRI|nr:hypothetical protein KP509_03G032700 [Ceratopteris richardii]